MTDQEQANPLAQDGAAIESAPRVVEGVQLLGVDSVEVEESEEDNGNEAIRVEEVSADSDETVAAEASDQTA